jgi:prepilin-type N-terminal cleavage/methylation domain-containing protein
MIKAAMKAVDPRARSARGLCTARSATRGFTVLEMVVVVAIIGVVLTVILTNQALFNRSNLLVDTAYNVALSVRQTQSVGLSGKGFSGSQNTGYGIHVETAGSAPITTYTQFADIYPSVTSLASSPLTAPLSTSCTGHVITDPNSPEARPGNCLYDSTQGELVQAYKFQQGYTIGGFCGFQGSGCGTYAYCSGANTSSCSSQTIVPITALDIVFERPNLQSIMIGSPSYTGFDTVCIEIDAPAAAGVGKRYVQVSKFGQVIVSQTCTP